MTRPFDPLTITLVHDLLVSIPEEMGELLAREAASPNIAERRDASCGLFDGLGRLVAQASHIPVHLGSLADSVEAAAPVVLGPGDMILLNDPYRGGAHLPDLTLVAPAFAPGSSRPDWFVACRAHHADVGGLAPGSMGPARSIDEEGLLIPPVRLVRGGTIDPDVLALVRDGSRTPDEREADLKAQIAACRRGLERLTELLAREGTSLGPRVDELMRYGAARMRALIARIPAGVHEGEDFLDDDGFGNGPIAIRVRLARRDDLLEVDFTGSAPAAVGNVNATRAVTRAAVMYVLCSMAGEELPINAGCLEPVRIILPEASVVNAASPSGVASGNTECSQRIADVLFRALARALPESVPAASQGTMNSVTFGGSGRGGAPFAYYETIGGGGGASIGADGASGWHIHMSNTRNTPVEALECDLPVRLRRYALRAGTGGAGRHTGGDGVIREFEFLVPVRVSISSDRRILAPWGLEGGGDGAPGRNTRVTADGRRVDLPGKVTYDAAAGERLIVETPGGGGYGTG